MKHSLASSSRGALCRLLLFQLAGWAVLNARYNYALSAGSVDDQSYLSFGLGVAWNHGY